MTRTTAAPDTTLDQSLRAILEAAVGRQALPPSLTADTPLLGHLTELDSMAVLSVLTQIQEELGCEIADDDLSADLFETYGTLRQSVAARLA